MHRVSDGMARVGGGGGGGGQSLKNRPSHQVSKTDSVNRILKD